MDLAVEGQQAPVGSEQRGRIEGESLRRLGTRFQQRAGDQVDAQAARERRHGVGGGPGDRLGLKSLPGVRPAPRENLGQGDELRTIGGGFLNPHAGFGEVGRLVGPGLHLNRGGEEGVHDSGRGRYAPRWRRSIGRGPARVVRPTLFATVRQFAGGPSL